MSKYFFNDNILGKSDESRVVTIKNQISNALKEIPRIREKKKYFLLYEFSKLRKAKKLTKNITFLFNPEYLKLLDKKSITFKIFKSQENSEHSFYGLSDNEINLDNKDENLDKSFIFNNEEAEYFGDDENSFKIKIDDLLKKNKINNEESIYPKKFKNGEEDYIINNFTLNNNENEKYSLISDYE